MFLYKNFWHYETIIFRWRNLHTLLPPLIKNFLANGNFLQHGTEWFPYEDLRVLWDKTNLKETHKFRPPLLSLTFLEVRNKSIINRLPYRELRHYETLILGRKNIDTLNHLLCFNFFANGNLLKYSTDCFPYATFGSARQKKSTECREMTHETEETSTNSNTRRFGTMTQQISEGKVLILSPPLLSIQFFACGSFLKRSTARFLYKDFCYCKTTKIWQKILT